MYTCTSPEAARRRRARPLRHGLLAALAAALTWALPPAAAAQPSLPTHFRDSVVFSGLEAPTAVRFARDGRVVVAEQSGRILVFDNLADPTPTVLADLGPEVHAYWDRGLLGLELDPAFPTRPYVYVAYAHDARPGSGAPWNDACPSPPGPTTDGCVVTGRLSRLTVSGNVAVAEQVLIEDWCQQFPSHSVGDVRFGPDGALYASGGEGASFFNPDYGQFGGSPGSPTPANPCGDPGASPGGAMQPPGAEGGSLRSQSLRRPLGEPVVLSGTVIRVDPATGLALPDNPLAAHPDLNARRIVAYGLRNPFRFALRPGTGELWVGDVGEVAFEEIDRVRDPLGSVANFGWPCYEGPFGHDSYLALGLALCSTLAPGGAVAPYFSYNHWDELVEGGACTPDPSAPDGGGAGASITGIAFYDGTAYPTAYRGALFFADRTRSCIWTMPLGAGGDPDPSAVRAFEIAAGHPVDLEPGPGGDLFYVDYDGGTIHRIEYGVPDAVTAVSAPATAVAPATITGAVPFTVTFDGTRSTSADGSALTYEWDLDGDGAFDDSTAASPDYTYDERGTRAVRVRVTDAHGVSAAGSPLTVRTGAAPVPTIATPTAGMTWRVGQTIDFSGTASDLEDGALPPSALSWTVVMHHCSSPGSCHTHTIETQAGTGTGALSAPDHEYPSWLELRLTATDSDGLRGTIGVELQPQTVDLTLASAPTGAALVAGGTSAAAPFVKRVIVGSTVVLGAPAQTIGGGAATFTGWSDGGAETHAVVATATPTTYTASFSVQAPAGGSGGGTPPAPPPPPPLPPPAPPRPPEPPMAPPPAPALARAVVMPAGRRLQAVRKDAVWRLSVRLRITGAGRVQAQVLPAPKASRAAVVLARGTQLGSSALRSPARRIAVNVRRSTTIGATVRLAPAAVRGATRLWLVVRVTSARGTTTTTLPFRVRR